VMKISNNPEKTTLPGIKNVLRFYDSHHRLLADLLYLEEEEEELLEAVRFNKPIVFHHPSLDLSGFTSSAYSGAERLLSPMIQNGSLIADQPEINTIRNRAAQGLGSLDQTYKRLINPHRYKVSISTRLKEMKTRLIREYGLFEASNG